MVALSAGLAAFDAAEHARGPSAGGRDFAPYLEAQDRADRLYLAPKEWAHKAILNIAGMGAFSADRTIREYARGVWNLPV